MTHSLVPGPASVSDRAEASAEPENRAPGLGRPESRDEALCHPASRWGAAPPRRWVWPQSQYGGLGSSHDSEVEGEERIRGVRNKWVGDISRVQGRQGWSLGNRRTRESKKLQQDLDSLRRLVFGVERARWL